MVGHLGSGSLCMYRLLGARKASPDEEDAEEERDEVEAPTAALASPYSKFFVSSDSHCLAPLNS